MARPAEGLVERGKLLEQKLILLQRRDRFRAARADIHAIAHEFPPLKAQREPKAFRPQAPVRASRYSDGMGRPCGTGCIHCPRVPSPPSIPFVRSGETKCV